MHHGRGRVGADVLRVCAAQARESAASGEDEMVEAILWAVAFGALSAIVTGIRRFPWRYCAGIGLGFGIVVWAMRLAMVGIDPSFGRFLDPGTLVLIGAFGGGLTQFAFDRGERAQQRRTAAILGTPPPV